MKKIIYQLSALLVVSALLFTSCKKPAANFTSDKSTVAIGEVVTFTDGSTDAEKGMFVWNFGDGGTSTLKNPTHVYERAGTYTVTQTVATKKGKNPTDFVLTITVEEPTAPVANFTSPASVIVGEVITFENTSTDAAQHVWDFGDGTTSHAVSPTHIYQVPGAYKVVLTVYWANNEKSNTKSVDITVTGGTGNHATSTKLIGEWDYDTRDVVETRDGAPYATGTYTNTYTSTSHEFIASGSIIQTDANNNETTYGSYNIIDATRMWYNSSIYSIVTLNTTTLQLKRVDTNPTYWTGSAYVVRVVTTTYNYSK